MDLTFLNILQKKVMMPFVLDSFQDVVEQTASVDRISIFCPSPGREVSHLL